MSKRVFKFTYFICIASILCLHCIDMKLLRFAPFDLFFKSVLIVSKLLSLPEDPNPRQNENDKESETHYFFLSSSAMPAMLTPNKPATVAIIP